MAKSEKKVTKVSKKAAAPAKAPKSSKEILAEAKPAAAKPAAPVKASKPKKSVPKANGKAKAPPSSDESSESSSSEDEKPKAAQVKAALAKKDDSSSDSDSSDSEQAELAKPTTKKHDSSSDSDDSSDSEDEDEKPQSKPSPSKAPAAKKAAASSSSESDSDSDSDDEPSKPAAKAAAKPVNGKKTAASSSSSASSSDSDSDSDDEAPKKVAAAKKANSSSSDSDDSESDSSSEDGDGDVKMADAKDTKVNGGKFSSKRKADDDEQPAAKKFKTANGDAAPAGDSEQETKSIFVGQLSWAIDNDRLAQEFAQCGDVESATVQTDRNTGRSRGFGYVHFTTTEAVDKALKMNGQEIDGRPIKVDRSLPRDPQKDRQKRAQAFGDSQSPPSATLFVGNLSFGANEDSVWSFFGDYSVKTVRLPTDRETGRPKGFGYVEFEDIEDAKKAHAALNGQDFDGRNVRLDFSQPRDSTGGGGGGRGGRGGFGGGFGGDRGGRGGGRGGFGDRGRGGGRGGFGDRGRGGGRGGRGGPPRAKTGGITAFEGKKTTF